MARKFSKHEFIDLTKSIYANADNQILKFISEFVYHDDPESTLNLFSNGYCYHFAQILKTTFDAGEICWVAPYSHIVWIYEDIPYDIHGVYSGESTKFIPISFLGHAIEDFRHNPKIYHITSKSEIDKIIRDYDKFIKNKKEEK